jgi:hypothetical protein
MSMCRCKSRTFPTGACKHATTAILAVLIVGSMPGGSLKGEVPGDGTSKYFAIQVVDRQTGRGVPLVELRTVNNIQHFTDSNGVVAFNEPGLMDKEVFFFVESHGYEFPKDGFGFRGVRLKVAPGASAVVKIDRLNIAERLYRVTGGGIYRDTVLTGGRTSLANPVLNGQVFGQDSVCTCIYNGRLFWMWGDTARPSYPLGHFAMAGAVSDLPGRGGLDPAVGVNLEYFVGEEGFSRPMCPFKEPGMIWLDGLLTVADDQGRQRMVAKFARVKSLGEVLERGMVVFNDANGKFEPVVRGSVDFLPYAESGHPFSVNVNGQAYYYFAAPVVRMRVKARWSDVLDPNQYEVLTALPDRSKGPRWISFGKLTDGDPSAKSRMIESLKKEKERTRFYDVVSGKEVCPHAGSVYFNAYRQRWISIFVQQGGETSFLGEIWYAEADTPVGPWTYARKIATHTKYSLYNPKQHPYFDQDGGRTVFFEGTYSYTFSGSPEAATPRYDYNQIMYRLRLEDSRLVLPVPVYQVQGRHLLRDGVEKANAWDRVESVPFYAIEPNRPREGLVSVYAGDGEDRPVFCGLPASAADTNNPCIVPLYEYRQADASQRSYSTDPELNREGWVRAAEPVCRVWKSPEAMLLLDGQARHKED